MFYEHASTRLAVFLELYNMFVHCPDVESIGLYTQTLGNGR